MILEEFLEKSWPKIIKLKEKNKDNYEELIDKLRDLCIKVKGKTDFECVLEWSLIRKVMQGHFFKDCYKAVAHYISRYSDEYEERVINIITSYIEKI